MPNWCNNILEIHADTAEKHPFVPEKLRHEPFSFENILPTPSVLQRLDDALEECQPIVTEIDRCWLEFSRLHLCREGSPFLASTLSPNGLVRTQGVKRREQLPLEHFLQAKFAFAGISQDTLAHFLDDLNKRTGTQAESLAHWVKDCVLEYNSMDSNDWHYQHWGTKWDACDTTVLESTKTRLTVQFLTAWEPPVPVIQYASKQYPDCTFQLTYGEPDENLYGRIECKAGKIRQCSNSSEELRTFLGLDHEEEETDKNEGPQP